MLFPGICRWSSTSTTRTKSSSNSSRDKRTSRTWPLNSAQNERELLYDVNHFLADVCVQTGYLFFSSKLSLMIGERAGCACSSSPLLLKLFSTQSFISSRTFRNVDNISSSVPSKRAGSSNALQMNNTFFLATSFAIFNSIKSDCGASIQRAKIRVEALYEDES
jgi:hypothetical protein